jgi:hypothetical protein
MKNVKIILLIIIFFSFILPLWADDYVKCNSCGFKNHKFLGYCTRCNTKLEKGNAEKLLETKANILVRPFALPISELEKTNFFLLMEYRGKYKWMDNKIHVFVDNELIGIGKLWKETRDHRSHSDPFRVRKYKYYGEILPGIHNIRIEISYYYYTNHREHKLKFSKISIKKFKGINFRLNETKKLKNSQLVGEE